MSYELKLGFFLKKGRIHINNLDELTDDGRTILDMIKSGDDATFQKCCELLQENLSVLYITSGVYELEEIFEGDEDEIEANEIKVVKIFQTEGDEICFSAEGSFTIPVCREIKNEDHLREIEEELEGSFDNGVTIQVLVFEEDEDDPFADLNGGDGDMISGWEGLGVRVLN
jgi:hypothetical protein